MHLILVQDYPNRCYAINNISQMMLYVPSSLVALATLAGVAVRYSTDPAKRPLGDDNIKLSLKCWFFNGTGLNGPF